MTKPNSTFHVKVVVQRSNGSGDWYDAGFGFFGIGLPEGWKINDSIPYRKCGSTGQEGFLVYRSEVSAFPEDNQPVGLPELYHWWGAKTTDIMQRELILFP